MIGHIVDVVVDTSATRLHFPRLYVGGWLAAAEDPVVEVGAENLASKSEILTAADCGMSLNRRPHEVSLPISKVVTSPFQHVMVFQEIAHLEFVVGHPAFRLYQILALNHIENAVYQILVLFVLLHLQSFFLSHSRCKIYVMVLFGVLVPQISFLNHVRNSFEFIKGIEGMRLHGVRENLGKMFTKVVIVLLKCLSVKRIREPVQDGASQGLG
jgi:hypothetical protein